ncbi:MAG: hypothetical protein QOK05_611 [Chloroflexota bacterium]|jgi:3-oxoacyl-[acyl-carrier protein] reductase|nr:hypothetical protein [Chloroflexota bacterium]
MPATRVAIVTGAATGLGRAMTIGLLGAGWSVAAVEHRQPSPPAGPGLEPQLFRVPADITREADCERVVHATLERFGSIGMLVNNAGISHQAFPQRHATAMSDVDPVTWRQIFDVNVHGTFLMTRATYSHLVGQGWGRIINITTSRATMLMGSPLPYAPSKAAVEAMTAGWAKMLRGTGVTVNALLPGGPADTPAQTPALRSTGLRMWPAEIMVPPLLWLASSAADDVTGRRYIARLWDAKLPPAQAAEAAGFPAAWPLEEHDEGLGPPA